MFYVFIFNFHKKSKYVKQFKYSQGNFAGGGMGVRESKLPSRASQYLLGNTSEVTTEV